MQYKYHLNGFKCRRGCYSSNEMAMNYSRKHATLQKNIMAHSADHTQKPRRAPKTPDLVEKPQT